MTQYSASREPLEMLIGDAAARARDAVAERRLTESVARHFALVWRSLRRFGVPESSADDAAQHVFLTLSDRLAEVPVAKERAFLLSVVVRVAANFRRGLARSREVPSEQLEAAELAQPDPEALLEHKQRLARLDHCLSLMPDDQRAVFVLYELEGCSLPEIADALGIPLGTATSRLRRARDRFETWVERHTPKRGSP